eukprot:s1410_g14.t1
MTCFVLVFSGKLKVSPKPKSKICRSSAARCRKMTKPDHQWDELVTQQVRARALLPWQAQQLVGGVAAV